MNNLTKDEARVLGVLVEKALTTPGQYPMTLNSLVSGCNQRSNRLPILKLDENRVMAALDSLKVKDFVREVMLASSRVTKFRHTTKETLGISISELVVLAELLLRGPQTPGHRGAPGRAGGDGLHAPQAWTGAAARGARPRVRRRAYVAPCAVAAGCPGLARARGIGRCCFGRHGELQKPRSS